MYNLLIALFSLSMIRMPSGNVTNLASKCFICLMLFLFCACNEKQKESTSTEMVQPDIPGARGEEEPAESSPKESVEERTLQLSVYPNPASDNLYLEVNEWVEGMAYYISSSNGPTILQGNVLNQKEHIDIRELNNGTYYIKVVSRHKNSPALTRLVIQR